MDRRKFVKQITMLGLKGVIPFTASTIEGFEKSINWSNYKGDSETTKLLSRLDLSRPGLEKVKALRKDPAQAVRKLLS